MLEGLIASGTKSIGTVGEDAVERSARYPRLLMIGSTGDTLVATASIERPGNRSEKAAALIRLHRISAPDSTSHAC